MNITFESDVATDMRSLERLKLLGYLPLRGHDLGAVATDMRSLERLKRTLVP